MFNPDWRKLWIGSLVLATLCGFTYGWKHRSENLPFVITRKAEEPPEVKLLRKGRYDDAAKAALDSIKDEKKGGLHARKRRLTIGGWACIRGISHPNARFLTRVMTTVP